MVVSFTHKLTTTPKLTKLEGASPDAPSFLGSAGALPSRKTIRQSLFAIRCRFWLSKSIAFPNLSTD